MFGCTSVCAVCYRYNCEFYQSLVNMTASKVDVRLERTVFESNGTDEIIETMSEGVYLAVSLTVL